MTSRPRAKTVGARRKIPGGATPRRNPAIDRFRGALVILMVGGDYLAGVNIVPDFLKHAPDVGLTAADLVASAFIFVIGLNFGTSFARRRQTGLGDAYRHFVLRYLALIGIGAIISAGAYLFGQPSDWGVLQAIGVAGLIALLFIRLPAWARFVIGVVLLVGYQYVLNVSMLNAVVTSVHGGLVGALSWAAMLILATAVADVWRRGLLRYAVCCAVLVVVGAASYFLIPVSKHRVSISFVLITLALSAVVFLLVDQGARLVAPRPGVLSWWGENALALYLLHLLILAAVVAPPIPWWYVEAPVWLVVIQLVAILGVMTVAAWWMHGRRWGMRSTT